MASRSTKLRPDEKLAVAIGAGDRRRKSHDIAAAERGRMGGDLGDDRLMDGWVAHDSLLDVDARGFELRLHQGDDMGRPGRKREGGRQHRLEGNEAYVDGDEIGRFGELPLIEGADVGPLQGNDLRLVAQARMKLAGGDVDRPAARPVRGEGA